MWRLSLVFATSLVLACGNPPNPPADPCAGKRCSGSDVCNSATGLCEPRANDAGVDAGRDAGPGDAGLDGGVDAGLPDAGLDAGTPDAGVPDAGLPDAGIDAGAPIDAGCASDLECFGALHCDPTTRDCVECVSSTHCLSSVVPVCDLRVHQCVGCVASSDCANPTPVCDQAQCIPCTTSAECGAGRECSTSTFECVPLNDTCASARAILPAGTGLSSISAEPGQGLDDAFSGCGGSGPELVYSFTTTSVQNLSATATPFPGTAVRPALYLRAGCTGVTQACDAPSSGAASLSIASLPAGTYFLFVEAVNATPGRVSLSVSLQAPPSGSSNDTCASPAALAVNGASVTRSVAIGNTVLATNESSSEPTCSVTARSGPDLVYSYTLTARANVTAIARPISGSTLHPVVSLRSACATAGAELSCVAASAASAVQASVNGQLPGTYFVSVDSADATTGAFQLEVEAIPTVDNDGCSAPQALTFSNELATATGDTTWATNGNVVGDQSPSCSDSARGTGRDVVFSYTLASAKDVTLTVTPTGMSPTLEPVISVRGGASCGDAASTSERGCVSLLTTSPATLSLVNQPAGTYFVWLDSARDTSGPFQLEVQLSPPTPPPANDSCAAPQALSFVNGVASFSGSTLQAANDNYAGDVSPTCSPSAKQNGRDVVYAFTLAQAQDVAIDVTPSSGSTLIPAVYVRRNTCTSQLLSDEVVCDAAIGGVHQQLTRLAAGTYFLFIDSSGSTRGGFTGSVTLTPPTPAPANDSCNGQALVFSGSPATATANGSTVAASNSNAPVDNAPACGTDFFPRRYGRDLVYSYTLSAGQDVDITVTPANGSQHVPVIYVRAPGQCMSFSAGFELACVAQTSVQPLRVYLPNQTAGTYFLFVDSNALGTGDFSLSVTLRPPTTPPGNDGCGAPLAVPLGATGVQGDTTAATDSYSSLSYATACRRLFLDGRDLVYAYTASATGTVTATVTPEATFNPALLLLQPTCAPAQCVRLVDAAGAGVPESFSFPVTMGQTYYLVVDSANRELPGAFGRFSLTVQ